MTEWDMGDIPEQVTVKLKSEAELVVLRTKAELERAAQNAVYSTIRGLERQVQSAAAELISPVFDQAHKLRDVANGVESKIRAKTGLNVDIPGIDALADHVSMLGNSAVKLASFQMPDVTKMLTIPDSVSLTGILGRMEEAALNATTGAVNQCLDRVTGSLGMVGDFIDVPNLSSVSFAGVSKFVKDAGVSITKFVSELDDRAIDMATAFASAKVNEMLSKVSRFIDFSSFPSFLGINVASIGLSRAVYAIKGAISGIPAELGEYVQSAVNERLKYDKLAAILSGDEPDDIDFEDLRGEAPGLAAEAFLPTKGFIPAKHLAVCDAHDHTVCLDRLAQVYDFGRGHYYDRAKERYSKKTAMSDYRRTVALKINNHGS